MTVINTNMKAMSAQEASRVSDLSMAQSMQRLSTGVKINSAKDDAAGLAISNRMTSQIRGFAKAIQNTNDAISMTQTANAGITNVQDVLQRMRELAVQASTGTLNPTDRAAIQTEVSQLKSQIDTIASTTNHNNIKLLDGSAQNVQIQTGVNAGQQISIGFDSMASKDIGIGSKAVVTSAGGTYSTSKFAALTASSLYLNGVAVGQSQAVDDPSSYAQGASSAVAKAAAINRVASLSGVYAKADSNFVAGTAMTAADGGTATIVTINGVATDSFANAADNSLTRKTVVSAINAKSAITGVVATDTGDDNLGVTLTAVDGRNITLEITSGSLASSLGLKQSAATTFVASFDLFTYDGRSINVSTTTSANQAIANSGLVVGTYKADTAITSSYARSVVTAGASASSSSIGLLNANSMVINGVQIGQALTTDDTASDVNATSSSRAASAIAIAAAINRSSAQTGVTANAQANNVTGTAFQATAAGVTSATMYINGFTVDINAQTRDGVINSVNSKSGQTGVVATANGEGITYTATDGRNISLGLSANLTVGNVGLTGNTIASSASVTPSLSTAVTFYSTVQLSSTNQFTVKSGSNGVTNLELLGFRQGTFGGVDNGQKINQVDVSTSAGASTAIATIDAALTTVNSSLAKVGAFNNRLDSVISNLSSMNQNITASRGRITDTDYSTETTNLAKQQIIQQASTAMLAQANQSSQNVLSLLK
jgi:flagellin